MRLTTNTKVIIFTEYEVDLGVVPKPRWDMLARELSVSKRRVKKASLKLYEEWLEFRRTYYDTTK